MSYDSYGSNGVNIEGRKPTYSATIADFVPAATATDMVTITGAANKICTITNIRFTGSATTSTYQGMYQIKRAAANSGGTSSLTTITPHDSSDIAPSAVVKQYSANPSSVGTAVGTIRADHLGLPSAAAGTYPLIWDFCDRAAKGIRLNSATENLAINFNGNAVPIGTNLHITIEWTEEATNLTS
jgi:hypothetical protein